MEEEDAKRVNPKNHDVYTKVELKPLHEEGLVQVSLNDTVFMAVNPLIVPREEDSFALGHCLRLHYESLRFLLVKLLLKLSPFSGQPPSGREEVILVRKDAAHLHEVLAQMVLARQVVHAGEVIYALKRMHLLQQARIDAEVKPHEIPLFLTGLFLDNFETKLIPRHFPN